MEKMKFKPRSWGSRKSKGYTLLEILLVLAVLAVFVGIMFYVFTKVNNKSSAQTEAQSLVAMAADVKGLFSPQGNFTNISDQVLVQNNVPPTSMVSGTNIVNSWGGAVTVAAAGNGDSEATFQYDAVPTGDSCSSFVQGAQSAFATVSVNGQTVKDITSGTAFSTATLGAACNGSNGGSVSIIFTLMK